MGRDNDHENSKRMTFKVERSLDRDLRVAGLPFECFSLFLKASLPVSAMSLAVGVSAGSLAGAFMEAFLEILLFLLLSLFSQRMNPGDTERIRRLLSFPSGIKVRPRPWRRSPSE